jgi:hypothetical protein
MIELLDRHEVPIQPVKERGQYIDAVVPVHLGVAALDLEVKMEGLDIDSARSTVIDTYNEDMDNYLMYLSEQDYDHVIAQLRNYWEFNPDWILDAEPSETGTGFLKLVWREDGQTYTLVHDSLPVPYQNRHDEKGSFYLPSYFEERLAFPIVYRRVTDPVFLLMPPEKMRQYGVEVPEANGIIIDPVGGIAEVVGTSFDTDYVDSVAKALVLRNYGVAYLNQLTTNVDEYVNPQTYLDRA